MWVNEAHSLETVTTIDRNCTKSSPKISPRSGRVQEDIFSNKTGVMYTSPRGAPCSVVAPEKVVNRRHYWQPSKNASDVPPPRRPKSPQSG